jgi:hypothetical protein
LPPHCGQSSEWVKVIPLIRAVKMERLFFIIVFLFFF